jgi:hypothetical protein
MIYQQSHKSEFFDNFIGLLLSIASASTLSNHGEALS